MKGWLETRDFLGATWFESRACSVPRCGVCAVSEHIFHAGLGRCPTMPEEGLAEHWENKTFLSVIHTDRIGIDISQTHTPSVILREAIQESDDSVDSRH